MLWTAQARFDRRIRCLLSCSVWLLCLQNRRNAADRQSHVVEQDAASLYLPLFHAYARLYVGVFDDDGESGRDDFVGRIVLDVASMRPESTYDVTLPLRQSAHVYMKRPRGAVRVRFHVSWYSERTAMLSYKPRHIPKIEPNEGVTVNCCDVKSFQNAARTVHGTHMPGRFSMKSVRALIREINFTRIHILRYMRKRELRNLVGWKYPIISAFVFLSWMHSVYANTVRYVPGHLITVLLLYLWKNYANFAINDSLHRGFLPPTWEEMLFALCTVPMADITFNHWK